MSKNNCVILTGQPGKNPELKVTANGKEIAKEFRVFQNLNARCQRNTISFVLSPSIQVGNKLTKEDFKNLLFSALQHPKNFH